MSKTIFLLIFISSFSPAFSQQIDEIMHSYFEAVGGEDKLANIISSKALTTGEFFPGVANVQVDPTYKKPPPSYSMVLTKLPNNQLVSVYNKPGGSPWMYMIYNDKWRANVWINQVQQFKETAPIFIDPAVKLYALFKEHKLSFEQEDFRNNKPYHVVRSIEKNGNMLYYINTETHLLDLYENLTTRGDVIYYKEYEITNMIRHPFLQESYNKNNELTSYTRATSFEFNPSIESDDIFYNTDKLQRELSEPKVKYKSEQLETGDLDLVEFITTNFKNKKVFVDLWATWCGPCKNEFRGYDSAYYNLMDEMNLSLLYLSIDKDAQKKAWEKDIDKLGLKGVHARANKKMIQTIAKFYADGNIVIPRYLIFNESGAVISDDFTRPSSPDFKENIEKIFPIH